jgi:guanylate kinase
MANSHTYGELWQTCLNRIRQQISEEEFARRIEEGDFLEYDHHMSGSYGTPRSFVKETLKEKSVIMEIDVVGGLNAKKEYPGLILVFIMPPSQEELVRRLTGRNSETPEAIAKRLARMDFELSKLPEYDYVIVNDDFETALKELSALIDKEKNK